MSDVIKIVSAVTASLLASLRFIVAVLLALLLPWILVEMGLSVLHSCYSLLSFFFLVALIGLLGATVWRFVNPQDFGVQTASSGNLNIMPLAILDVALVLAAIFVSSQLSSSLTTPLLHFCQTIFNKLTS